MRWETSQRSQRQLREDWEFNGSRDTTADDCQDFFVMYFYLLHVTQRNRSFLYTVTGETERNTADVLYIV